MAHIVNRIPIMTRDEAFAKRLTSVLKQDIKKRELQAKRLNDAPKRIQNNIESASKAKQRLDAELKLNNDIIKESEAAKAYNGIK